MALDFSKINLEIIDINTNATPDIFINTNAVTISKRVLEDLGYPQTVQYGTDPAQHIFAIRVCKSNETRAVPFSKARADQVNTLSITNKNLRDVIRELIPDYKAKVRYKVTGQFDAENRTMYYDMSTAEECEFRGGRV